MLKIDRLSQSNESCVAQALLEMTNEVLEAERLYQVALDLKRLMSIRHNDNKMKLIYTAFYLFFVGLLFF